MQQKKVLISNQLHQVFLDQIDFDPIDLLNQKREEKLPVDYFDFYNSVSSVYSSKIEGEEIDFDSFFKHKFLKVPYNPDYTKKSEDLFQAYQFIQTKQLTQENVIQVHKIISQHLLPESQRGKIRNNPMYVINEEDRIEYVACEPNKIESELSAFYEQIEALLDRKMGAVESFFFASQIHLVFVKIHPFQDGNGRTGRLLEKWFLLNKLGSNAVSIELEKNYYLNREDYYNNLRRLGLEYKQLDYSLALDFLLMSIKGLEGNRK